MQPDSPKYLGDIRDAAAFVLEETRESDLQHYLENRLLRQAVERNFEIIGEALNRLRRADSTRPAWRPGMPRSSERMSFTSALFVPEAARESPKTRGKWGGNYAGRVVSGGLDLGRHLDRWRPGLKGGRSERAGVDPGLRHRAEGHFMD